MLELKKGDRVRIKKWEKMKKEFGLKLTGSIDCELVFTEEMKYLCGKEIVVTSVERTIARCGRWNISRDMVEPIEKNEVFEIEISFDKDFNTKAECNGKRAKARLCPDDKFNAREGIRISTLRLLGVKEENIFVNSLKTFTTEEIIENLKERV